MQQVVEGSVSAESLLNVGSFEAYADFIDLIREKNAKEALRSLNKVYEDGIDLYVWTGELVKYLRDILFVQAGADEGLVETTDEVYDRMQTQAQDYKPQEIADILSLFMEAQSAIKSSFITQLPLELAIVKSCGDLEDFVPNRRPVAKPSGGKVKEVEKASSEPAVVKDADEDVEEDAGEEEEKRGKKAKEKEKEKEKEKAEEALIELETVIGKWPEILKKTSEQNSSIQALLKSSTPTAVEGGNIILEVMYAFHKERLESQKNRKVVEEVIKEVCDVPLRIKCRVIQTRPTKNEREVGNLTDLNVVAPTVGTDNALDLFDGGLPLI